VLSGGVKRIGAVAGRRLSPFMCIGDVVASLTVLGLLVDQIPAAFGLVCHHAFNPVAVRAGTIGYEVLTGLGRHYARIYARRAAASRVDVRFDEVWSRRTVTYGEITAIDAPTPSRAVVPLASRLSRRGTSKFDT
jgi:hypothetical protein